MNNDKEESVTAGNSDCNEIIVQISLNKEGRKLIKELASRGKTASEIREVLRINASQDTPKYIQVINAPGQ